MEPLNGPDCIPVSCVAAETRYPGNLFGDAEATSYIFFPAVEVCKPRDQRSGGRRRHPGRGLLCARSFNKVLPASSHAPPPPPSVPVYQGRRQPGTQGRVDGHVLLPELLTKGVAPTGTSFASISLFKLLGEGVCESCSFTQGRLSSSVTDQ